MLGLLDFFSTFFVTRGLFWASGLFLIFFGPRGLFWAFCGLLGLFLAFSGLGAFSGPFEYFFNFFSPSGPFLDFLWAFSTFFGPRSLFWVFCGLLSSKPFLCLLWASEPLPSIFWPQGLFWAFCGLLSLFLAFSGLGAFAGPFGLSLGAFSGPFCGLLSLFLALFWPQCLFCAFWTFFQLFLASQPFLCFLWASGSFPNLFWPRAFFRLLPFLGLGSVLGPLCFLASFFIFFRAKPLLGLPFLGLGSGPSYR